MKLVEILALVKELPEEYLEETYERVKEIKEKADKATVKTKEAGCPCCNSKSIVRNGHKHRKQAYLCRDCGKSFVETTNCPVENSRGSATVRKQVVKDTVEGAAIDKTAENPGLSHVTVFNMRHKILVRTEREFLSNPPKLSGVCETDETYVLENLKGRKLPDGYYRKPRKHGAKAQKRGISDEYVCICTGINEQGASVAVAVNRATPGSGEILEVFGDVVNNDTLILCEGNKSYDVLESKCKVAVCKRLNKANGPHGFIKARLNSCRGVATVYINRYNAFFSKIFADTDSAVDAIYNLMTSRGTVNSISHTKSHKLCLV